MASACLHHSSPVKATFGAPSSNLAAALVETAALNVDKPNVAVFLPRNTCLAELAKCLDGPGHCMDPICLERNILNDQLKALTLYLQA
jgi:hypothetical protein